jgi:hypothetical protein
VSDLGRKRQIQSRRRGRAGWGSDLPDDDGPGYVSMNGGFGETNRSLIGQIQTLPYNNSLRNIGH